MFPPIKPLVVQKSIFLLSQSPVYFFLNAYSGDCTGVFLIKFFLFLLFTLAYKQVELCGIRDVLALFHQLQFDSEVHRARHFNFLLQPRASQYVHKNKLLCRRLLLRLSSESPQQNLKEHFQGFYSPWASTAPVGLCPFQIFQGHGPKDSVKYHKRTSPPSL